MDGRVSVGSGVAEGTDGEVREVRELSVMSAGQRDMRGLGRGCEMLIIWQRCLKNS